ncbi:MAG: AraC family transcriptional regulator [Chthoniobacterales bacterium]
MAKKEAQPVRRTMFESKFALRLLYCGRYRCSPGWKIENDRLATDMMGFLFVEKNSCWAKINDQRLDLKRGDLLVFRGGDLLDAGHNPKKPVTVLSLAISMEYGLVQNILLHRQFSRQYHLKKSAAYIEKFNAILDGLNHPFPVQDLITGGALMKWATFIMEELRPALRPQATLDQSIVEKILSSQTWAMEHLSTDLTLEQWARETGWPIAHFKRMFKRETGLTPMRWLEGRRMDAARQYLCISGQNVTEIAEALGYSDPFYFSRVFRKHFGKSPLHYRKLETNRQFTLSKG